MGTSTAFIVAKIILFFSLFLCRGGCSVSQGADVALKGQSQANGHRSLNAAKVMRRDFIESRKSSARRKNIVEIKRRGRKT